MGDHSHLRENDVADTHTLYELVSEIGLGDKAILDVFYGDRTREADDVYFSLFFSDTAGQSTINHISEVTADEVYLNFVFFDEAQSYKWNAPYDYYR